MRVRDKALELYPASTRQQEVNQIVYAHLVHDDGRKVNRPALESLAGGEQVDVHEIHVSN